MRFLNDTCFNILRDIMAFLGAVMLIHLETQGIANDICTPRDLSIIKHSLDRLWIVRWQETSEDLFEDILR